MNWKDKSSLFDPNAPPAIVATAKQVAAGFNANFIPQTFAILPAWLK